MTASYLIGLREGLEITLVVTILVAFLVKSDRKGRLPYVWAGVAAAVGLSVGFGALLSYGAANLSHQRQELFDAVASIVAVVFVTWMIFWMRRVARRMGGELRHRLEDAIHLGPAAIVVMAFLSVVREGLETAILFFAAAQGAAVTAQPVAGISLGLLTAVIIGWLLYLSAVRINLARFFTWTGALLVLVSAGIAKYGIHDLQEGNVLPGAGTYAFDLTRVVPPDSWYAELLRGMVNLTPQPSVLESVAWLVYAVPVLWLFLRPAGKPPVRQPAAVPVEAERVS
jgi:high-affinity iron transporter